MLGIFCVHLHEGSSGKPGLVIIHQSHTANFPTGQQVVLYWASCESNFNLETTSPLKSGASWSNLPGANLPGLNYYFTNGATGSAAFFRLRY